MLLNRSLSNSSGAVLLSNTNKNKYIQLGILLGVAIIIYIPIVLGLFETWYTDANYSHGFLIPVLSGYLIYDRRKALSGISLSSNYNGLIILCSGLMLYIFGTAASEYFSVRLSLIVVLTGIVIFILGTRFFKNIWFPMTFLFFMVPLPYIIYYKITFPLQLLSTQIAATILKSVGIPLILQGNIIHLQNYSLEVVEACSGLRSLMTLSALSAAIAYVYLQRFLSGILLIILTPPIAILANTGRIIMSAIVAIAFSPNLAKGIFHDISGLVIFLIGLILVSLCAIILKRIQIGKTNEEL
ncbi:exosortase [candidate division KSB1 bacterium]|nr:exosortase [candidate division KSB1 bacterium]